MLIRPRGLGLSMTSYIIPPTVVTQTGNAFLDMLAAQRAQDTHNVIDNTPMVPSAPDSKNGLADYASSNSGGADSSGPGPIYYKTPAFSVDYAPRTVAAVVVPPPPPPAAADQGAADQGAADQGAAAYQLAPPTLANQLNPFSPQRSLPLIASAGGAAVLGMVLLLRRR